jgi:hypothetical protein
MEKFPVLGRKGRGRNQSVHIKTVSWSSRAPGVDAMYFRHSETDGK